MPRLLPVERGVPALCADCIGHTDCFFQQLPANTRATVAPLIVERAFAPGEVLLQQGGGADALQVVKVGDVLCRRQSPGGQEHAIALVGRGQVLGFSAIWQGGANPLTCEALTAGRVCEVSLERLRQAQVLDAGFLDAMGRVNVRHWNAMTDWAMVARLKTVDERVAGVLCLLTRVHSSQVVRVPNHLVLASIVGSSREAVVRALKHLESDGRIARKERGWYEVHLRECHFCMPRPDLD